MIDIHMHVLPGVDDGSTDRNMSLQMLKQAWNQGITDVICVFHSYAMNFFDKDAMKQTLAEIEQTLHAEGIPIHLYFGCEHEVDRYFYSDLKADRIVPLAGSKYAMIEFTPRQNRKEVFRRAIEAALQHGYIPVIAHVERYRYVTIDDIKEWKQLGARISINVYSLYNERNESIREQANRYVEAGLVDYCGTDAHRTDHRPPAVKDGIEYLYKTYPEEYVNQILYKNAQAMLRRED